MKKKKDLNEALNEISRKRRYERAKHDALYMHNIEKYQNDYNKIVKSEKHKLEIKDKTKSNIWKMITYILIAIIIIYLFMHWEYNITPKEFILYLLSRL